MQPNNVYNAHILLSKREALVYQKWCAKNGISYTLLQILDLLYQYPDGAHATFICETMFVYKQTLTGLLRRLEKEGLAKCGKDARDGRKKRIMLTQKGRSYTETVLRALYQKEEKVYRSFAAEEIMHLNQTYEKLVDRLAGELAGE